MHLAGQQSGIGGVIDDRRVDGCCRRAVHAENRNRRDSDCRNQHCAHFHPSSIAIFTG